jgi:ComF family protein
VRCFDLKKTLRCSIRIRESFFNASNFLRCPICGGQSQGDILCDRCKRSLKEITEGYCPLCGNLFPVSKEITLCGDCLTNLRQWDWFGFYGVYNGLLKELITSFKYLGDFSVLGVLQELLYRAYVKNNISFFPDIVVPVPIHINRLRKRGFNQSLEISRLLVKRLGFYLKKDILIRVKDTVAQVGLNRSQRQYNVKNAFKIRTDLKGKNVLLVDDVFTTGATVRECVRELKKAGAKKIGVLVVARSVDNS